MTTIQAIVVSRGLLGMLRACLSAAAAAARGSDVALQLAVVDNGSADPYRPEEDLGPDLPVSLVRLDAHHGFAECCNLAARHSESELLLLLNNDVFLEARTLAGMLRLMADASLGVCGAGLVFPDETIQHAGVVFGAGEAGPHHRLRRQPIPPRMRSRTDLQAVTGACMLIRRDVYAMLGGLDETFPFGLEDIDFCLRARQRAVRVGCFLDSFSLHFESMTDGREGLDVPSRRLFMERWHGRYTIDG